MIQSWQLPVNDILDISLSDFTCAKNYLLYKDGEAWFQQLWNDNGQCNGNKLRTYRLFKHSLHMEYYVSDSVSLNRSHLSTFSKLRCGSLPLEVEHGRFSRPKVPLEQRMCKFCNCNLVEDEIHFLTVCNFLLRLKI